MMPDCLFRTLPEEEAESFRQWARDNFKPGTEASELWHPIVRAEWARLEAERFIAPGGAA